MAGRGKAGRMVAGLVLSGMVGLAVHHYSGSDRTSSSPSMAGIEQSAINSVCADQNAYNSTASSPGDTTNNAQLGQAIHQASPGGAAALNALLGARGGTSNLCPTAPSTTTTAP